MVYVCSITSGHIDPQSFYNILRFDRKSKTGGGICALIAKQIRCSEVKLDVDMVGSTSAELLCFDVFLDNFKLRFFLVYRPPDLNCNANDVTLKNSMLINLISDYLDFHCTNYLLGDFNLPKIDWNLNIAKQDGIHDVYFDCFSNLGLYQFVMKPTRCCSSGTDNILDLILSNDQLSILVNEYSDPLGASDHIIIDFSIVLHHHDVTIRNMGFSDKLSSDLPTGTKIYDWTSVDFASK